MNEIRLAGGGLGSRTHRLSDYVLRACHVVHVVVVRYIYLRDVQALDYSLGLLFLCVR